MESDSLTIEQIEAEGWKHTGGKLIRSAMQTYEKNLYMLGYTADKKEAILLIKDPSTVPDYYLAPSFRGEIKDIDTFRIICKALRI